MKQVIIAAVIAFAVGYLTGNMVATAGEVYPRCKYALIFAGLVVLLIWARRGDAEQDKN